MNRRLSQFIQAENLNQIQLAEVLSVSRGSLSHILSGRNRPGFDFIESLLLHYPNLNIDWLITGKGRMYRDASQDEKATLPQPDLFSLPVLQTSRKIERITVYYDDNTFEEFVPKK